MTKTKVKKKKTPSTSLKKATPMAEALLETEQLTPAREGDVLEGKVIRIDRLRMFVDLDSAGTGVIYGSELKEMHDWLKALKPGDTISVKVVEPENEEGYVELSLKEATIEKAWTTLKESHAKGEIVNVKVADANHGGLIINYNGIQGFLPVSHLSQEHYPRVEGGDKNKIYQLISKLINETLRVKVIDLDEKENRFIVSEKAIEEKEIAEVLKQYKVGDVVEGKITGIINFGAFMKFGNKGLEGLIHISELDWQIIDNPSDVIKVGDKVKAEIISIKGSQVSLSLKRLQTNPWDKIEKEYKKGDEIQGTVTKFNPFGAFVKIKKGVQGLVHISEFNDYKEMEEKLELGKKYKFLINSIEPREYRMSLSLKKKQSAKE